MSTGDSTTVTSSQAAAAAADDDDDSKRKQTKTIDTTSTQSDNEKEDSNFWKSFVDGIYSNEKLILSSDVMQSVLSQIENCSEHVLEHESEYESFYTSIVSFCSLQLLEIINTCNKSLFLPLFFENCEFMI